MTARRDTPPLRTTVAPHGTGRRTETAPPAMAVALDMNLRRRQGTDRRNATLNDWYMALAYTVRDRLLDRYIATIDAIRNPNGVKVVAYLSAEFLTGPHLGNCLVNLELWDEAADAVASAGHDLATLLEQEEEPGLGNGGLGRLAACYMDSLSTIGVPAIGYGIRYEFGIFDQSFRDGWQVESTDKWLRFGNPWEIVRSETSYDVAFGGHTEWYDDGQGVRRVRWVPQTRVKGIAYDTPIPGYRSPTANLLRLWKAEAIESFDLAAFNVGDYDRAVSEKVASETISKVLYPNDEVPRGKQLRLAQQHFFVSCSLQDMIRLHLTRGLGIEQLDTGWAAQLNDTHPALAIAELMRLLMDEHQLDWERAWLITQRTCAYTNHTLLVEALEKWPLGMFGALLPRHLEIVFEINRRLLADVAAGRPGDDDLLRRISLIDETGGRSVRMAHLASAGSHAINGVAALHTSLLRQTVLADFNAITPDRFHNVTNGVTPRRWLVLGNPRLSALLTRHIGDRWIADLEGELARLEPLVEDGAFRQAWRETKAANKRDLAALIADRTGTAVNPDTLFDIQVKRLHEYKRQHLNVLYLVTQYARLTRGRLGDVTPRTVIFGGKAAPGYRMAKLIIRLINGVAAVINRDPAVRERLTVVFLPDFNVKNSRRVYPAADLSEQISTAGKEASGTGNMKFAMNGALTIGTLDGANVEIREAVGPENFFLFGLNAEEVARRKAAGYRPREIYDANPELRETLDLLTSGLFSNGDRELFRPIVDSLLDHDDYMLLADYAAYLECQDRVSEAYRDVERWTRMSILNSARAGRFSSDRSVREYCQYIWGIMPPDRGRMP